METCPQCGASVRAGARFCLTCGAAMAAPPPPPAAPAWPEQPAQAPAYRPPAAQPPAPPAYQPPRQPGVQPDSWQQAPQPDPWPSPPPQAPVAAGYQPPAARQPAPADPWQPAPRPVAPQPATAIEATELDRALARTKSYIAPAVLVFYLYFLFYLPGLIINRMYLTEAREMEALAGRTLPGTGCLNTLLWLGILPGVLLLILIVSGIAGSAGGLLRMLF